jgi:Tfp pilus assembly protein PilN
VTIVTSEVRLTSGSVTLPRVNLLPPEIAEKRAFRRIQIGLSATVLVAVAGVGLLYSSAASSVSNAQSDLDAATATGADLKAQAAEYSEVTASYARAAAAQVMLQTAMGDEVRYSQLLNDLSLSVPSNVWLKSITYTQTAPASASASASAPVTAAATTPASTALSPIGTLSATALAFSHDDVALWLESLSGLKTYANPYFSASTEELIGVRKVVSFTSSAVVTGAAQSGRYKQIGG